MPKINEEKINEIRAKADIVEIIAKFIPVARKGKNYVATCPFHDDHDPSMSISPEKQIYKCFVCGKGGNVFNFVADFEHITFIESVLRVADMVGVDMNEYQDLPSVQVDPKLARIYKVHQAMIEFTNYTLMTSTASHVKNYLNERGISDDLITKFEIGYNPKMEAVYQFLHAKKFSDEDLLNSQVVRLTNSGIHDVFENRITIPIHDRLGHPIAFTARRLQEDSESAKYINTQESLAYHKGDVIFNYHRAKAVCKQTHRVLLVEGAMDVIAFAKVGIADVVATLGTACTKNQLNLLKNLHCEICVCYDGDEAGIHAIYKFGLLANEQNIEFSVVDNKTGLDPDEVIDKYGKEELVALSKKTMAWQDFLFDYLAKRYDLNNHSQKVEFANEMKKAIDSVKQDFLKMQYFKKLFDLTGFDLSNTKQKIVEKKKIVISQKKKDLDEYEILSQMLISIQASNEFKDTLGFLIQNNCNKLALYIINEYRSVDQIVVADLMSKISEPSVVELLSDVDNWELAPKFYNPDSLKNAINKVRVKCIENQIELLIEKSRVVNSAEEQGAIINQINELRVEKNKWLYMN